MRGWNLPRRGQWIANSVVYGSVVQIRDVTGNVAVNVHNERPLYRVDAFPFERPTLPVSRARKQPARLLQARYEVVDFTGREQELAHLGSWRDTDEPVTALLLHGAGGQGKSRLAAEFARVSRDLGWRVLQARHASDPASGPGHGGGQPRIEPEADGRGTLLIVDYAEHWPAADLLELCADATRQPHRARMLLISRSAGVWWQTLAGNDLDRMEIDTEQLALGPLVDEGSSPHGLFAVARDRFAAALDTRGSSGLLPPQALAESEGFREALALHMAALATVYADHQARHEGQPMPALGTPQEVSAYLLTRERAHWRDLHASGLNRTNPDALGQSVYVAALTGAQTYSNALDAVTRADIKTTYEPPDRILRDHAVAYPAEARGSSHDEITFLEPLYPDRLAEDFLALSLPGHSVPSYCPAVWSLDTPARLLNGADEPTAVPPTWTRSALAVLTATAARWPHVTTKQLVPLLTARPQLALQAGGSTLAALANLPDLPPAVLEGIAAHLPEGRHTDLDPGSAVVAYRLAHHRLAHTQDPLQHATVRTDLAHRLSYAGLRTEAIVAAQEALPAWRHLAREDPTASAGLASTLMVLGSLLSDVGREEDALGPSQEAVVLLRRTAVATPAGFALLALALSNLGMRLIAVGRSEEAISPAREAVAVARESDWTDPTVNELTLAGTLANLGSALAKVGRLEEALAPIENAAVVFRRFAHENPDAYEPDLAHISQILGRHLAKLRQWRESLVPAEEAVEVYRRLAVRNPAAYELNLADALADFGTVLSRAGLRTAALAPADEAVETFRRLAAANPAAYESGLASALSTLGAILQEVGRLADALEVVEEAIAIDRRLAEANPSANAAQLASALANRGNILARMGRTEAALASTQGAVEAFRWLVGEVSAAHEPELAMALTDYGRLLSAAGHCTVALTIGREAVEVHRRLAKVSPTVYQPALAMALNNLGHRLSEVDRHEDALAPTEESIAIRRRLAADNPEAHGPGLAMSLTSLAGLLSHLGRTEEAIAPARLSVSTRRPLVEANPASYQHPFAVALMTLGFYLSQAGRPREAAAPGLEAIGCFRRLASADPIRFEPELATALLIYAMGQSGRRGGDLANALAAVVESVEMGKRLFRPDSGKYAHHVRVARGVQADILDGLGRTAEASRVRAEL